MQPSSPIYFLDMPFAENGDKTIIPAEEATADGRATQSEGFPEITQQPIASGGIAPNRWDFNGMFFLLSQFAHWEQSGGQATWNSELGYTPPSIVYYNKVYYVCVAESGPETAAGAVVPSSDDGTYWQTLWDYLSSGQTFVTAGDTVTLTGDTTGSGTFDSSGNVSVATTTATAAKLGSSTVGGTAQGIYLSSGKATAMSKTVGSGTKPVFLSSGTVTASSSTVGSSTSPVYLKSGTITECGTISATSAYKRAKNGYFKLAGSGIIVQWGYATYSSGSAVTFPIAFPNACWNVQTTYCGTSSSSEDNYDQSPRGVSKTGFYLHLKTYSNAFPIYWIAIGY